MMARDELAWISADIRISLISVVADSNQRMSCFPRWGWGRPHPTAWSIQYDQTCRGLALAALLETTPTVVLLKNKPVTTDL